MFSATITFKTELPDHVENIIYFRAVLLGSLTTILGSAISTKNHTVQNILYSITGGLFSLIVVSTYNLMFDELIDLDLYFDITVLITFVSIVILTLLRLWARYRMRKRQFTS